MAEKYKTHIVQEILNQDQPEFNLEGSQIISIGLQCNQTDIDKVSFRINNGDEMYIGRSGIYELEVSPTTPITSLRVNCGAVNENVYIDYIYLSIESSTENT